MRANTHRQRKITLPFLILTNIALLGSFSNWPIVGKLGMVSLFCFLIGSTLFYLPSLLVIAELGSIWQKEGGPYLWVKEALGHRTAFTVAWLLWLLVIFWIPIPLELIANTSAQLFKGSWTPNFLYKLSLSLVLIWGCAAIFFLGMNVHKWVNAITASLGMVLFSLIIVSYGIWWVGEGYPSALSFKASALDLADITKWGGFASILFALTGLEISAYHTPYVLRSKTIFPKAAFLSSAIVYCTVIFGTLAILAVMGQTDFDLFQNNGDILIAFFHSSPFSHLILVVLTLFIFATLAEMNSWYGGAIKGLLAVAHNGDLPPIFRRKNSRGTPTTLMITQAIISTLFTTVYLLFPKVSHIYWIFLSMSTALLYLFAWLFIFASAIRLRYSKPNLERPYRIPGGNKGIWIVGGTGFLSSLAISLSAFLLPRDMLSFNTLTYFPWFALILIIIFLIPQFILTFKKPSWKHSPPETTEMH